MQASQPMASEPLGPFAHVPDAHAAQLGGVLQGLSLSEQEKSTAATGQPSGAGGRALPVLDLGSVLWAQDDGQGGLPATHGDTEDSRCETRGDPPLASRIVPMAAYCQFGTLPLRHCTQVTEADALQAEALRLIEM